MGHGASPADILIGVCVSTTATVVSGGQFSFSFNAGIQPHAALVDTDGCMVGEGWLCCACGGAFACVCVCVWVCVGARVACAHTHVCI